MSVHHGGPAHGPSLHTQRLLLSAGGAVSAAAAGGAAIGGLGAIASARSAPSHEQNHILTFLLGLERIEQAFYAQALAAGALRGELAEFAEAAGHERGHVGALAAALGTPGNAPPVHLAVGEALRSPAAFVATAAVLEDAAVAAFNGQVANLTAGRIAQACSIVSVDARHAAWIRDIGNLAPAAQAADGALAAGLALPGVASAALARSD